ncbi:hypothetical protein OZX65_04595 [Leuconostocaceae bacterium ESL0723]|nr:hypothetical protein [Lactobacillaceae bacterium L1_55_11]WEV54014.1 hypothetical protein OZX65_04595 [Leuconostocaceae bacterium ESL0723]
MQYRESIHIRQQRRHQRRRWTKVLWITLTVIGVIAVLLLTYAYSALWPMVTAQGSAEHLVKEKTNIVKFSQVTVNYRDGTTYGLVGQTASGDQRVAIVQDGSKQVKTFPRSAGMSNAALQKLLDDKYHPKRIYEANISYYKGVLVWEISYESKNGQLNYLTLDFKTGKPYRVINGL